LKIFKKTLLRLYLAILIVTVLLWRLQGRIEVDEMEFGGSLGGVARLTISYVMEISGPRPHPDRAPVFRVNASRAPKCFDRHAGEGTGRIALSAWGVGMAARVGLSPVSSHPQRPPSCKSHIVKLSSRSTESTAYIHHGSSCRPNSTTGFRRHGRELHQHRS